LNVILRRLLITLIFAWPGWSLASVEQLSALVAQGKTAQAYTLAQSLLAEWEGDPAFDLPYAIAAIDSGELAQGMFALERLLIIDPQLHSARLELARAFYLQGNLTKARQHFEQVLEQAPPPQVEAHIRTFLLRISEHESISRFTIISRLSLQGGYDDNINASPDRLTGPIRLSPDALGRGDAFIEYRLTGDLLYRSSDTHQWVASAGLEHRQYQDEDEQNNLDAQIKLHSRWLRGADRFQLGAGVQHYRLDDQGYRDSYQLLADWSRALSAQTRVSTELSYHWQRYKQAKWKDSRLLTLGLGLVHQWQGSWSPAVFSGVFAGRERPETEDIRASANVDRRLAGGYIGLRLAPVPSVRWTSSLVGQHSRYRGDDWLYNQRREDQYYAVSTRLEWGLNRHWVLSVGASYHRNDSSVELYDYNRKQVDLGLQYRFQGL